MSLPSKRSLAASWLLPIALSAVMGSGRAETAVRLTGWEGPAVLFPNNGPGREYFELVAQADWAPRAAGRYALRVTLPGGRSETQGLQGGEGAGSRRLTVLVPAPSVRNILPAAVVVRASVVDASSGAEVSNVLTAVIEDFPHPDSGTPPHDPGPFGWGAPLEIPPGQARPLPRPGPDGWEFVRVASTPQDPGFFIATTEATVGQLRARLAGYDPRAGRSDEFALESADQPAVGLTPRQAQAYLSALSRADRSGLAYRLPTRGEWLRAARAGRPSAFWWGDEPAHPEGANFLGPEPALDVDSTAAVRPPGKGPRWHRNPWGLWHTFGNVAEWAVAPSGGFARMGGHFRTEPASPQPEVTVADAGSTGPDPYVGVRPAFDLDASTGSGLARRTLRGRRELATIGVAFDPDRATATLTGWVAEPALRRAADGRLASLWFLAALDDRIETPAVAPGQLAQLGAAAGPARRVTPLGRWYDAVPIQVRWFGPLPVSGSEWWVNVFLPGGRHQAHRLVEVPPGRSGRLTVMIESSAVRAAEESVAVALSLGAEATAPADPRIVSNVAPLRWRPPR